MALVCEPNRSALTHAKPIRSSQPFHIVLSDQSLIDEVSEKDRRGTRPSLYLFLYRHAGTFLGQWPYRSSMIRLRSEQGEEIA